MYTTSISREKEFGKKNEKKCNMATAIAGTKRATTLRLNLRAHTAHNGMESQPNILPIT